MKEYAKLLTKDYLEQALGIGYVSEDGKHIYRKNGKEITQCLSKEGYYVITVHDRIKYSLIPEDLKTFQCGQVTIGVHRIVYAWHNGPIPSGLVVDHWDDDKTNNNKDNLRIITPGGNIWKYRPHDTREIICNMKKPRSFYENKLNKYEKAYVLAKQDGDQDLAHKLRANISNTRARLRYYDSHKEN